MFKGLHPDQLQSALVIGVFCFTLFVFILLFVRAICMGRDNAQRLGQMPLQDDEPKPFLHPDHESRD